MKNKIMIIGGHGKVGQYITRELKNCNLVLAGRNEEKMKNFLGKENIQAEIYKMDIDNIDLSKMEGVSCVIVCVDQQNTTLVEFCDKHAIDYMDVTANSDYIEKIQRLQLQGTSRILLGVGLAPGLTNLLAEKFVNIYPSAETIDIQIILGLGDKHGDAAIKWTLDNFMKDYSHKTLGKIKPFERKSAVKTNQKRLRTYNFNFVDQHMLNQKYEDKSFTTFLGFDLSSITAFVYGAKQIGVLKLLNNKKVYHFAESFLRNPKFGTDIFLVAIHSGGQVLCASGHDEGRFTGLIAAEAAKRIVTMDLKKGLLGISDIISVEEVEKNKLFGLIFTTS
jgi:hypothetical protein